jgi:hypothetical protein
MLKDLKNWNKIPTETYKSILEDAKVRYNELLSQSENITGKVIQTLLIDSAIVAWFTKYLSENKFCYRGLISIVFVLFTLFIYYWLVAMLYPRKIVLKGTSPNEALGDEVDLSGDVSGDNYTEEDKVRVYYYHQVNRYKRRIESLRPIYNTRAERYKKALVFSLTLFALIVAVVLSSSF